MTALKLTQNRFSPLNSATKSALNSSNASILPSSDASRSKDGTFVPSSSDTGKTKSINPIQGIPVLNLGEAEPEENDGWKLRKGGKDVPVLETIVEEEDVSDLLQFSHEDIKTEVSFLDNGVFIVRFSKSGGKDALLKSGYYMFDNKPVIIKPWVKDMEMVKEKVEVVPVWAKLHGLPLKFWGSCLPKIANLVGKYVKLDLDTQDKIRLSFARIMVEVPMDQQLPGKVKFLDESGTVVTVTVEYEWRPISCTSCKGIGHEAAQCRKPGVLTPAILTPTNFPPLHNVRSSPVVKSTPVKQIIRLNRQDGMVGVRLGLIVVRTLPLPISMHSIGFWNVRGLNDLNKQRVVKWFMHNNGVGLFGLLETKLKPGTLLKRDTSICDGWSVSTNCSWHKGGKIWILWKPSLFDIQFLSYNAQHIHMLVSSQTDGKNFLHTMIYAFNGLYERVELWNILKGIVGECNDPWLWLGDFNIVLSPVERLGGNISDAEMEHFQDCVSICEIEDIPATRALFTWSNKQGPCDRVYSRLDRVMGNQKWMDMFGTSLAHFTLRGFLTIVLAPLWIRILNLMRRRALNTLICGVVIPPLRIMLLCLGLMVLEALRSLLVWLWKVETIQKALIVTPSDPDLLQQEVDLAHDLKELIATRDSFLLQKAKIQWSLEGDLNTSYFHHIIKKGWCLIRKGTCCSEEHWNILAQPVTVDELLTQINATIMTLIPKTKRPTTVKHFRSISCCNVIYKAISKILCNRLVKVLPDIISKNQGAFVKGRSILENILICQDLVRMYHRGRASPRCMFKLDLQKAYDSIEWQFVNQMLMALRFPEKFSKGDVKSIMLILRAIATFSAASGVKVNASKSEVVFSCVAEESKHDIIQISGYQESHLPFKYLGVPIQPGSLTMADCNVKKEGGLGIKEAGVWNTASVGKLVHWLYTKADRLWVLWIDHVYLKGAQWDTYLPPPDYNWNWRNICRVKGLLEGGYQNSSWIATPGGYSVGVGYQWLQGSHPHVYWYKDVWDTWILPKHSLIGCLIQKKALNTRAKIYQLGLCMSDRCVIFEVGEETHEHLFGDCVYSTQVIDCIEQWLCLHLNGPLTHYSKLQRKTCRMVRMDVYYMLWTERNKCRLKLQLSRPEHLVTTLKKQLHYRIVRNVPSVMRPTDCAWLSLLSIQCNLCT
ncbi:uncharacterized protein LOC141614781 [Silene latifolia]|uniref:uncharacterized protein LOC141614781 n=1 Tax=Silene latifolia TaxID=37657 RepID=UPI003D780BDA